MHYLVASDLHYRLPQLDWIVDQSDDVDAVVLVGDHLDLAGHVDLGAQIAFMKRYLERLAETTHVIVDSGNHDLSVRGDHGDRSKYSGHHRARRLSAGWRRRNLSPARSGRTSLGSHRLSLYAKSKKV